MLQQTQVSTVLPYYKKFLRKFCTVHRLAAARESQVLASWAGLGYYNRARNLHRAAKIIVRQYGGKFPASYPEILALPGIGRYTAGAILSIAFGKSFPVVDGNVERVLARVMAWPGDVKTSQYQKQLWGLVKNLVPAHSPGDFNQAMMELGATVCLRRQPHCPQCPIENLCLARQRHLEQTIPQPRPIAAPQKIHRLVAVIQDHKGRVLLCKRSDKKRMKDFWEMPLLEWSESSQEHPTQQTRRSCCSRPLPRLASALHERFGREFVVGRPLCTFTHSITSRRIHVAVFNARMNGMLNLRSHREERHRWVAIDSLRKFLFDSASLKILTALQVK